MRSAFTLVELLVVISIIVVLMGILVPAVGYMQDRAAITKTKARITQISGALTTYQTNQGRYPMQDGNMLPDTSVTLDEFYNPNDSEQVRLVAASLASRLAVLDRDSFGTHGSMVREEEIDGASVQMLTDAWDQPIYYQPWTVYISQEDALNPDSVQIWSFGSDGVNDVGLYARPPIDEDDYLPWGDDVTNWSD